MKLTRLVFVMTVALVLLPATNVMPQQAPKPKPFIVGGTAEQDIHRLHWQVALVGGDNNRRDQFCGGSLIAPDWVLTAAHCVDNFMVQIDPKRVDVIAGTVKYDTGGERMDVERIVVHPKWKQTGTRYDFDAALLKLKVPAQLVKHVALIPPSGTLPVGPNVRVSGWGAISEGGPGSNQLLFVDVPVVSNTDCNKPESYDGLVSDQMFCAGAREGGLDSCQGDSGGPVVSNVSGTNQLVGVVSWGFGCARELKYGVYTRVTSVSQWVVDTMAGK